MEKMKDGESKQEEEGEKKEIDNEAKMLTEETPSTIPQGSMTIPIVEEEEEKEGEEMEVICSVFQSSSLPSDNNISGLSWTDLLSIIHLLLAPDCVQPPPVKEEEVEEERKELLEEEGELKIDFDDPTYQPSSSAPLPRTTILDHIIHSTHMTEESPINIMRPVKVRLGVELDGDGEGREEILELLRQVIITSLAKSHPGLGSATLQLLTLLFLPESNNHHHSSNSPLFESPQNEDCVLSAYCSLSPLPSRSGGEMIDISNEREWISNLIKETLPTLIKVKNYNFMNL